MEQSVFFEKELAKTNVINDKNKNLINYYKTMRDVSPAMIQKCKMISHKKWDDLRNKRNKGTQLTACEFWQLVNASYSCNTKDFGYKHKEGKQIGKNVEKKLIHYQNKLKKTKILNKGYISVTKQYDGKNTFFYVDPPYPDGADYVHKDVDPKEVADTFKKIKGKVMISYNDVPEVRNAFKRSDGWHIHYLEIPYTVQSSEHSSHNKTKELIITNY